MKTAHLSETQIQQVVLEPSKIGLSLQQHIRQCPRCQTKVANYRTLFQAITEQPPSVFDFDLSALVMEQLIVPQRQSRWYNACLYTLVVLVVSALSLVGYVNWAYLTLLTTQVSPAIVTILCVSTLSIVFVQLWINHQKHRGQMQALDGF